MFSAARIKLTGWYLLIIMSVSICFSIFIYQILIREVERFARIRAIRMQERTFGRFSETVPLSALEAELIEDAKGHIILNLLVVNGVIFVISGGLGFILAGRTLDPIASMVDEQNRFISDASHELRTPLTSLKSAMEVNLRDKYFSFFDCLFLL